MHHKLNKDIGVGPTRALSLRVSVATLVRVLFRNPGDDNLMLALERKATQYTTEKGAVVEVKAQPFGGAIQILNNKGIQDVTGTFNFDSDRSRLEGDFRIFIQPENWTPLRSFCIDHLNQNDDLFLETDPQRELEEEFYDSLKIKLTPDDYLCKPVTTILEENPTPTDNIHTRGSPTARIYRLFETKITNPYLARVVLENSERFSEQDLSNLALENARQGGKGRANAVLALPLQKLINYYSTLSPKQRNSPVLFMKNRLAETVPALLDGIAIPKFRRVKPFHKKEC